MGAVTGVRFAVQRERHGTGSSLVTTLVGVVAAITAITAALVFAANLDDLVTSPSRYGWTWGLVIDSYTPADLARLRRPGTGRSRLHRDHGRLACLDRGRRAHGPRVRVPAREGRRRARPARGAHAERCARSRARRADAARPGSLDRRHLTVPHRGGAPLRVKIVGRVLLPSLSVNSSFGLGEGAAFDSPAMRRIDPSAEPAFFLLDLAPGASERAVGGAVRERGEHLRSPPPG